MDGRTAVLRGNVASQADERMMQRLVSLEPGVSTVRSELNYPGKGARQRTRRVVPIQLRQYTCSSTVKKVKDSDKKIG